MYVALAKPSSWSKDFKISRSQDIKISRFQGMMNKKRNKKSTLSIDLRIPLDPCYDPWRYKPK